MNPALMTLGNMLCAPTNEEAVEKGLRGAQYFGYVFGWMHGHLNPGRDNIYRDFRRKQEAATATLEAQDTAVALEPEDESARALYRMGRRGMFMGSPAYIRENIRAYEDAHVDVLLFLSQCGDRRTRTSWSRSSCSRRRSCPSSRSATTSSSGGASSSSTASSTRSRARCDATTSQRSSPRPSASSTRATTPASVRLSAEAYVALVRERPDLVFAPPSFGELKVDGGRRARRGHAESAVARCAGGDHDVAEGAAPEIVLAKSGTRRATPSPTASTSSTLLQLAERGG